MPSRPLKPYQKEDCTRLRKLFDAWKEKNGDKRTQEEVALSIGAKQSAFSQRLNGTLALNKESASVFANLIGCDIRDFSPQIADEIDRLANTSSQLRVSESGAAPMLTSESDDSEFVTVKGAKHVMGLGASKEIVDEYAAANKLMFRINSLRKKGLQANGLEVWKAEGDSMKEVQDGDSVMFDHNDVIPKDDQLYVINYDGEIHLKKAMILDGVVYFCATNPDGHHNWRKPKRMDDRRRPIRVIGKAWWLGRWLA